MQLLQRRQSQNGADVIVGYVGDAQSSELGEAAEIVDDVPINGPIITKSIFSVVQSEAPANTFIAAFYGQ